MHNMNNMAKFHNSMNQSKQTLRNTMRIMDKLFRPIYQECCEEWSAQDQNDQKHGHQQTVQGSSGIAIEEGKRQKKRQRSLLLFGGQILFNSVPR